MIFAQCPGPLPGTPVALVRILYPLTSSWILSRSTEASVRANLLLNSTRELQRWCLSLRVNVFGTNMSVSWRVGVVTCAGLLCELICQRNDGWGMVLVVFAEYVECCVS